MPETMIQRAAWHATEVLELVGDILADAEERCLDSEDERKAYEAARDAHVVVCRLLRREQCSAEKPEDTKTLISA